MSVLVVWFGSVKQTPVFSRVNTRGRTDARGDTEDQEHHAASKPQAAVFVELMQKSVLQAHNMS